MSNVLVVDIGTQSMRGIIFDEHGNLLVKEQIKYKPYLAPENGFMEQDQQMYEYLRHYGMDGIVVATKADKVSRNELQKCMKTIRQTLKLGPEDLVIPVSALKKSGCEELLTEIEKLLEA